MTDIKTLKAFRQSYWLGGEDEFITNVFIQQKL